MGFVIWNSRKCEYQFPSINEKTSLEAGKKLVAKIGNDAAKWRFKIVNKEEHEKKEKKQESVSKPFCGLENIKVKNLKMF